MSTEKITYLESFLNLKNNYKYVTIFVYIKEYNMEVETFWLERRLKELKKTRRQLAKLLGVSYARLSDLKNGTWKFQATHIKKTADFLEFNRMAFLDFISGDITEEELWKTPVDVEITPEEKEILRMIRQSRKPHNDSADTSTKAG